MAVMPIVGLMSSSRALATATLGIPRVEWREKS